MQTKRFLTILLVVVLTMICGVTSVAAANNDALSLAVEAKSSTALMDAPCALKPGENVDISVVITKNSGISGFFEFILNYDPDALELPLDEEENIVYTVGEIFSECENILYVLDDGKLQFRVNATSFAENNKTVNVAVLKIAFKVKDTFHGSTKVTLSDSIAMAKNTAGFYDQVAVSVSDANTAGYNKATVSTHKFANPVDAAATCTTPATTTYTCSIEGCTDKTLVVETAPAKGHTPGAEATCTSNQTCTVCKAELAPVKAHTPGAAATCTAPQKCTVCSKELAPVVPHTPGAAATCTEPQKCTVCSSETAPALGHTPEVVAGKAATCTDKGLTEGSKCSVCDEVLKEQTEIAATGHSFGEWKEKQAATRQEDGIDARTCSACGVEETVLVPFSGLSTAAIVIIVIAIVLVLGGGGFCLYWFVIRKKFNA